MGIKKERNKLKYLKYIPRGKHSRNLPAFFGKLFDASSNFSLVCVKFLIEIVATLTRTEVQ